MAFLSNLEQNQLVQINIVAGTSASAERLRCLRMIESRWGKGWFERIPPAIRPPVKEPREISRRLITLITANSRLVPSLDETIATWTKSVEARTDEGLRRQRRTRLPTKQHIISHDVESLVHGKKAEEYGRRVVEAHMPGLKEDRLELRPLHPPAPAPAQTAPAPKAKRKRTGGAGASAKRVRKGPAVAEDAVDDAEQEEGDVESDEDPFVLRESRSTGGECDGPALALIISKMITYLEEWNQTERCCDHCKLEADELKARIRGMRNPVVRLKEITLHSFGGMPASSLPMHSISPEKPTPRRRAVTVHDSSDVD